jgi:DNA-binding IclR family transcriptional regulator
MGKKRIEKEKIDYILETLKHRTLSITDIAAILGRSKASARSCVDTLSVTYPIYEEEKGMFSLLH